MSAVGAKSTVSPVERYRTAFDARWTGDYALVALRRFRQLLVLVIGGNLVTLVAGDVLGPALQRPRPFGRGLGQR